MVRVQKKQWYKKAEVNYNAMAKEWNKTPGEKLYKSKDRFNISYCYHKAENRKMVQGKGGVSRCNSCGYCIPFAYDN